ncbi:MAG: hypothetical protein MI919_33460, partial [Holophagales bacterium]|nr:hypothetical protein [Holophagales bacterium]
FPDGSMEVKAAWKVLCTAQDVEAKRCKVEDDVDTFYHREVFVYNAPSGSCSRAELGLVGLHVIVKTFWAPQWIWATFEHVSNVPPVGQEGEGYSFFDPSCTPHPGHFPIKACSAQPFLASKKVGDPCCPNALLNRWPKPMGFDTQPNQITRLDAIDGSGLNTPFQNLMQERNAAFGNYVLVRTQWPLHGRRPMPDGEPLPVNMELCASQQDDSSHPGRGDQGSTEDPNCYTAVPQFSRNTVIESFMTTYIQTQGGARQVSNRSCMGCHAAGTDFSYIFVDAVEQIVPIASR